MEKSDFMNESRRSDLMNSVKNQTADPSRSVRSKRNTIELAASNKSSGRASKKNPTSQRQE